jgi:hypothetical protein
MTFTAKSLILSSQRIVPTFDDGAFEPAWDKFMRATKNITTLQENARKAVGRDLTIGDAAKMIGFPGEIPAWFAEKAVEAMGPEATQGDREELTRQLITVFLAGLYAGMEYIATPACRN